MNINNDARELLNILCDVSTDNVLKMKLFKELRMLLEDGVDKGEILNKIRYYKASNPKASVPVTIGLVMKEKQEDAKKEENLIEPGMFYFHPRLQVTPGMPVISFDIEKGIIESSYDSFYLKMVDKFTIENLVEYALKKVPVTERGTANNAGSLKYLLGKYDMKAPYNSLDLVLYMIDAASSLMKDLDMAPLTKLIKLDDFVQEGTKLYMDAYNTKKLAGMDKVI